MNTEIKSAEEIAQEFKELDIYLNDIYDYYIRHDGKDAGNLWIQFSDKFNAFKKKVTASKVEQPIKSVEQEDKIDKAIGWHEGQNGVA